MCEFWHPLFKHFLERFQRTTFWPVFLAQDICEGSPQARPLGYWNWTWWILNADSRICISPYFHISLHIISIIFCNNKILLANFWNSEIGKCTEIKWPPILWNIPILSYSFWNTFPHQKITFTCPSLLQMNLICVWNIHFLDIFLAMENGWKSNMFGDT